MIFFIASFYKVVEIITYRKEKDLKRTRQLTVDPACAGTVHG
jgi:hypothetical protein